MKSFKTTPDTPGEALTIAKPGFNLAGLLAILITAAALLGCTSSPAAELPAESTTAAQATELASPAIIEAPVQSEPSETPVPPPPSPTAEPTATEEPPTAKATPAMTAEATPQIQATSMPTSPTTVNGVPIDSIVVMDAATRQNVREIFAQGQLLGRDAHAFSKLGDSLIANPHFLTQFDTGPYNLGNYAYLQPVIDQYAGSYERYGVAIHAGLHSWGVFDPIWAPKEWCQANESIIDCEFRLNNPSILLILLGSNDAGAPDGFNYNLRKVVEFSIENGVVPVLATKADRFEGSENTNNILIRQIAEDFKIPLWEFDILAETIPGRGLQDDGVHLTFLVEHDYTLPEPYLRGHGVHNLTALMVLDAIRLEVLGQDRTS
jgi:hypothetical protein